MVCAAPHLNARGLRTSKTFDASKGAYDGVMEQKRVFLYDAAWRIVEEHIDTDFDTDPGVDWVSQHFWGLRYIDDLVAKRIDRGAVDGEPDWLGSDVTTWYMITDSQFSVVAVLDKARHLWERIEYDAYGNARHRPSGDVNGDGYYSYFGDLSGKFGGSIGDAGYHADWDLDFSGTVDSTDFGILDAQGPRTAALPDGWIGDPSSDLGPDNSIGYAGYVFNHEREDYTVRFRVYAPELGRWRTRDPIGYRGGKNLQAYVDARSINYVDPWGLSLTVNGDDAYRKNVNDALQEICPSASVGADGEVTVQGCDPGHEAGCECLSKLANSPHQNVIQNETPGNPPTSVPSNPNDFYPIYDNAWGPPKPGKGTGGTVRWDPQTTMSPDPDTEGPRRQVPDSVILAHELCGHVASFNDGNHSRRGLPRPGGVPLHEIAPQYIENILRKEMGYPPREPRIHYPMQLPDL